MEDVSLFNNRDAFFIAEALDAIDNSIPIPVHTIDEFNDEDAFYVWEKLSLFAVTDVDVFIPGTGLQSGRQTNTAFPNVASGDHSLAEGSGNTASGNDSHAEGNGTVASSVHAHSEGLNTLASGTASHAEGVSTQATNVAAHAEGSGSIATNLNAHAEGLSTVASGGESHSEGDSSSATGLNAHAEGLGSTASGNNSHAEGEGTLASALRAHAEGGGSHATAQESHAECRGTIASGLSSHSEGESTVASGSASHAQNQSTVASGAGSHSEGERTLASGLDSHAGGGATVIGSPVVTASGNKSFNHSENTAGQTPGNGARGANSAILGGLDNDVDVASVASVALGGNGNNIVGEPNTAQAQNLRVTNDFRITQGANKNAGTSAAMVAGTVTVANTNVKAGAIILVSIETPAGVVGILSAPIASIVNATSFVINSSSALDTSTVNYLIINP